MTRLLALWPLLLALGCSQTHSKADVDRGQRALTAALDSWKNNEPPDRTRSLPEPVEYIDEMRATYKLTEYTVGTPVTTDPDLIRFPVSLKLQDRKGKPVHRDVMYEVKLASPVVVARDPYY